MPILGVDLRPLVDPWLRGFARYTHELVEAMSRFGNVKVIGFTDQPLAHRVSIPVVQYGGSREFVSEQISLPLAIRRSSIDVFLCTGNRGLPFLAGCPLLLTLHDVAEWDVERARLRRGRSAARFWYSSTLSLAGASKVLAVSANASREIQSVLGVPSRRIRVIYEAAAPQFSAENSAGDVTTRARYGLDGGYVLYVGGFDAKKRLDVLLESFACVSRSWPGKLVLAGRRTKGADALVSSAELFGIEDRIVLTGYVPEEDLPAIYRGATCVACLGDREGFGLPVLEAMACGVPVVVADAGALPEVVGMAGTLVNIQDPTNVAQGLQSLLVSEDARSLAARAAVERASSFSWEKTANETEDLVREVMADRSPAKGMFTRFWRLPYTGWRCAWPARTL